MSTPGLGPRAGRAEWSENAQEVEALGVHFQLGSLADVIRSKEAAARPKDHVALPVLRELLNRQDGARVKADGGDTEGDGTGARHTT